MRVGRELEAQQKRDAANAAPGGENEKSVEQTTGFLSGETSLIVGIVLISFCGDGELRRGSEHDSSYNVAVVARDSRYNRST